MKHTERHKRSKTRGRWPRGWAMSVLVISWSVIVAGGLGILWRYEHAAGSQHPAPDQWPIDSKITPSQTQSTLLFFAHPKCPCTRASIGELAKIMTDCGDNVLAYVIFVKPSPYSHEMGWEQSDLWHSADQLPGVNTMADVGGLEAQRFAAETSGLVLLYDPAGRLKFRGGITGSRGHNGDNLGRSTIVNLLLKDSAGVTSTKVYGCKLGSNLGETTQTCCRK